MEQIDIVKINAEIAKMQAEIMKLFEESLKFREEQLKIRKESRWYEIVIAISATMAIIAFAKLFL
ncbi:MAG: hypothetical protein LBU39_02010 [Desulfobulbaceae bacterium]|nr:hypothetical protein [Desulfobulbaceae bacterium]